MADPFHKNVTVMDAAEVQFDGDYVTFDEGDSERIVTMMINVGGTYGEYLSVSLDASTLTEFRLLVEQADTWINKKD